MGAENRGAGICEDYPFHNPPGTACKHWSTRYPSLALSYHGDCLPVCLSFSGTWSPACRGCVPPLCAPCPRLSLIISPYLLPASPVASAGALSLSLPVRRLGRSRDPAPPLPAPPRPSSLAASGRPRPCHRPLAGSVLPRFLELRAKEAPGGDGLGVSPSLSRRRRLPRPSGRQGEGLAGAPAGWVAP